MSTEAGQQQNATGKLGSPACIITVDSTAGTPTLSQPDETIPDTGEIENEKVENEISNNDISGQENGSVENINHVKVENKTLIHKLLMVKGKIQQKEVIILIDPGAQNEFMSNIALKRIRPKTTYRNSTIKLADGKEYTSTKFVSGCILNIGKYRERMNFIVASICYDIILGKP